MPFDAIDEIDTPRKIHRQKTFTEDEIDDRLQQLQEAVVLPDDVWTCLLWTLCPEAMEDLPLADKPTPSLPGTSERLRIMAERARRGQALFHPDDATWEDASADRVAIAGCRLRNGVASRLEQPLVEQRHDGLHEMTTRQLEGFLLPKEDVLVAGRIAPEARKRRKKPAPCETQQLLLFASN